MRKIPIVVRRSSNAVPLVVGGVVVLLAVIAVTYFVFGSRTVESVQLRAIAREGTFFRYLQVNGKEVFDDSVRPDLSHDPKFQSNNLAPVRDWVNEESEAECRITKIDGEFMTVRIGPPKSETIFTQYIRIRMSEVSAFKLK